MSDHPDQLALPGILDGGELLTIDERRESGRYTGALIEKDIEKRDAIIQLLAVGVGLNRISKAFHVSPHVLQILRERHVAKISTHKKALARRFGLFAELGIDRMIDEFGKMDRDKLAVAVGIATEKMQLLDGEATAILGSQEVSRMEEVDAKLAAVMARLKEKQAAIVVQTHCVEEGKKQMGPALDPALPGVDSEGASHG